MSDKLIREIIEAEERERLEQVAIYLLKLMIIASTSTEKE